MTSAPLHRRSGMPSFPRPATVAAAAAALLLAATGCGEGAPNAPVDNPYGITATGPGVLTVSPLDTSTHIASTPLGSLAPPGHVLPTDHVYLYFVDPWNGQQQLNDCSKRPVRAAGSGVITFVLQTESTGGDTKVDVQMTRTFHYYYDHVLLKPGMGVGSHVNAGDTIATTTGRCPSIDLGVSDLDVNPAGFLNPARYGTQTGHAASPYRYFAEPLRSWLYAHVRMIEGVPANKDGRIDYGVAGRLVGDWFHTSLAAGENAMGPEGWTRTIAFAYDWFDGTQPRISIGGTIADPGLMRIASGEPDPASVTPANGIVVYTLTPTLGRLGPGWLVVQMLSASRIRVEYVAASSSARPTGFSGAAQEFVR